MPPNMGSELVWVEIRDHAIFEIQRSIIAEMRDCFERGELIGKEVGYSGRTNLQTLYLCKDVRLASWLFLRKKTVYRRLLRVVDAAEPKQSGSYESFLVHYNHLVQYNGPEPLKCYLHLTDPRLRRIAERILEPLAKQLGYTRVEYTDESWDIERAWWPGQYGGNGEAHLFSDSR